MSFITERTIRFHEADPVQIMYFANIFSFAHEAYEDFISQTGYTWSEWFKTKKYLIPIRHAEADFKSPFLPGDTYKIEVFVASFGTTSFKMKYKFTDKMTGKLHAEVKMVHAVLEANTLKKVPLPEIMKQRLSPFLENPNP